MIDPYVILGVSPSATQAEITHAYRSQLRDYHPDVRSRESGSGADDRLQQVFAAYRLLRDPQRRRDYDRGSARARKSAPFKVAVTRTDAGDDDPPLWVGPVRWHP
jgi:DnaJ-class molecular chaperone